MSVIYGNSISIISQPTIETIVPLLTNANTPTAITVKAMCYHDGYWYGVANDNANDLYKIYGNTMANLTIVKLASSRAYPVKGIVCDGTRVWICNGTGSYSGRTLIFQTIANFRSSNTSYNYTTINASSYSYEDICHVNDATSGSCVLVSGTINNKVGITKLINNSTSGTYNGYAPPGSFISCCGFNNIPCFISNTGTLGQLTNIANGTMQFKTNSAFQNAKKIQQLGDYLCITCVKSNGVYLYKLTSPSDTSPVEIKLSKEQYTIIGMAKAGNSYVVIGTNDNGPAVWESTDLIKFKEKKILLNGYTPQAMATDTGSICILGSKGTSTIEKALVNFGKKTRYLAIHFVQEGQTFNISTTSATEIGPITILDESGNPWANSSERIAQLQALISTSTSSDITGQILVRGADCKVYISLQAGNNFEGEEDVRLLFAPDNEYNVYTSRVLFYITCIPESSTYQINENPIMEETFGTVVNFTDASGASYTTFRFEENASGSISIWYDAGIQGSVLAYDGDQDAWTDEQYRTVTFSGTIHTKLLTWLQDNAILQ